MISPLSADYQGKVILLMGSADSGVVHSTIKITKISFGHSNIRSDDEPAYVNSAVASIPRYYIPSAGYSHRRTFLAPLSPAGVGHLTAPEDVMAN